MNIQPLQNKTTIAEANRAIDHNEPVFVHGNEFYFIGLAEPNLVRLSVDPYAGKSSITFPDKICYVHTDIPPLTLLDSTIINKSWDSITYYGVSETADEEGDISISQAGEDETPLYFSAYARLENGEGRCIADVRTEKEAQDLQAWIMALAENFKQPSIDLRKPATQYEHLLWLGNAQVFTNNINELKEYVEEISTSVSENGSELSKPINDFINAVDCTYQEFHNLDQDNWDMVHNS